METRVWKRDGWGGNEWTEKERKEDRESFIWLSQPWWYDRLGNPKRFTMPPPTRDNLPCCLTHIPSCRAHTHTHQLYLSPLPPPPSLPPSVSLYRIILPPPPKYHRSVKRYFQGPGSRAVACCVLAQKAKALHTHRWDKIHTRTHTHTKTYKTRRLSQYADDSICPTQIITLLPPFSFFSPSLSFPAWTDTCVCQYGEFTHHWQSWHCCCCLFSLSMLANVNHKEQWAGKTRTRNDSCEPHWAGRRG